MVGCQKDDIYSFLIYILWMKFIKIIIFSLFTVFFLVWTKSFSYFEDKMYCDITKDKIVISLDAKWIYSCKTYIRYIEVQMKKVYRDILLIQQYVDKKQDLWYWNPLKTDKVDRLNALQNIRLNIISHMQTFEDNLLDTSKTYFLKSILAYQKKLKKTLSALLRLENPYAQKYVSLVESQLDTIDKIEWATTIPELNTYIQNYVYLKKQLLWK